MYNSMIWILWSAQFYLKQCHFKDNTQWQFVSTVASFVDLLTEIT